MILELLRSMIYVRVSSLVQLVMFEFEFLESIRRTLCAGSSKLRSVLVSEVPQVWIITSPASAGVMLMGKRTWSLLFFHLLTFCTSLFLSEWYISSYLTVFFPTSSFLSYSSLLF